jgi:hypothetical protein
VQTRLTVAFGLLGVAAVVASALVTLQLGVRRAEAEANRRLTTAAGFSMALLTAERDRNRIDALEVASRLTIQQTTAARDRASLSLVLTGLRQTLRDDLLAVYTNDGALLASDSLPGLAFDEQIGLVPAALGGSATSSLMVLGGHLVIAATAPILVGGEVAGAVLAVDALDERFARRLGAITELTVGLAVENGPTVATEPLSGPLLSADQWTALRARNDLWLHATATPQPQRALARPLLGADNRPVGAIVIGVPDSKLTAIEPSDVPLYLALASGVLFGTWGLGAIVAWGLSRQPRRVAVRTLPSTPLLTLVNGTSSLEPPRDTRELPGLVIDRGRRRVEVDGADVLLTPTEFELLWALSDQPGRVVSRDALLEQLRGADWQAEPGMLDTHVSNLRRKIEPDPSRPRHILTVRGVGYKLADGDA